METFSVLAFATFGVGLALVYGYYKKRDKNYMVPAFVMMSAALVNTVLAFSM